MSQLLYTGSIPVEWAGWMSQLLYTGSIRVEWAGWMSQLLYTGSIPGLGVYCLIIGLYYDDDSHGLLLYYWVHLDLHTPV